MWMDMCTGAVSELASASAHLAGRKSAVAKQIQMCQDSNGLNKNGGGSMTDDSCGRSNHIVCEGKMSGSLPAIF